MNAETEKVLKAFAEEIYTLAQEVFARYSLADSDLARNMEKPTISYTGDSVVIELLLDHYVTYLENGRKPRSGKQPPTEALIDWARKKGIPTDNNTLYLVARAIWRDGQEARPILATLEHEIEVAFENEWADKLFDTIIQELTTYFN